MKNRSPSRPPLTSEYDTVWGVGTVLLFFAAIAILFANPDKSQTIASWVQAVGSIAAIFIALRIGQQQSKASIDGALNAQKMAEQTKQKAVLAIATAAHGLAASIRAAFSSSDITWALLSVYDRKVIEQVVIALNAAPIHDVGMPDGISALLSLRLQFVLLGNAVDAFISGPWNHVEQRANLEQYQRDPAFDRVVLEGLVTTGTSALRTNVFTHLDVIDRDYERLSKAIML